MTINEKAFQTIKIGDLKKIKLLLQKNPHLIKEKAPDTWTLLQCAIFHHQTEIAEYLIQQGIPLSSINREKLTALKLARQIGMTRITTILLNNGATK